MDADVRCYRHSYIMTTAVPMNCFSMCCINILCASATKIWRQIYKNMKNLSVYVLDSNKTTKAVVHCKVNR